MIKSASTSQAPPTPASLWKCSLHRDVCPSQPPLLFCLPASTAASPPSPLPLILHKLHLISRNESLPLPHKNPTVLPGLKAERGDTKDMRCPEWVPGWVKMMAGWSTSVCRKRMGAQRRQEPVTWYKAFSGGDRAGYGQGPESSPRFGWWGCQGHKKEEFSTYGQEGTQEKQEKERRKKSLGK